ncbi:hypothetical protein NDU88_007434 [Pleurodeles waltl]|uniref:Uncharacterized protein n=1 Tax=Pleurodeles waltl TaxID=8319 RepID=A0AAV7RSY3_PLEWA|nr:hypothetical protein NDU88_007434 [Pleurodeles waltl]
MAQARGECHKLLMMRGCLPCTHAFKFKTRLRACKSSPRTNRNLQVPCQKEKEIQEHLHSPWNRPTETTTLAEGWGPPARLHKEERCGGAGGIRSRFTQQENSDQRDSKRRSEQQHSQQDCKACTTRRKQISKFCGFKERLVVTPVSC